MPHEVYWLPLLNKLFPALDRYIFRLVLMPMGAVFLVAASLLMLDKMLKLFDFVATEGGPVSVVFKMLANLLPEYASLAIPLGLLMGILIAFRKLAISSELDIMRAVGLSYTRLLRVPYMIAVGLAVLNFFNVSYLQPLARYYYEQMQFELQSGALGASIKVGEFTTLADRMALRIEESRDNGHELIGVFARLSDGKGQVLSISAHEGRFLSLAESPDTIVLRLNNGQIVQEENGLPPRVLSFSRHDLPIPLPALEAFRKRGGKEREYILPELLRFGWADQVSEAARAHIQASFSYRMVEVVMMLLMPLLAVALAIPPKRSTSGLGLFVAIVLVVAYHKINEYGQATAARGDLPPIVILWGPFALFAALIFWMYWRVAYIPGGQPIAALERFFGGIGKLVKGWFRRHPAAKKLVGLKLEGTGDAD